MDRGKVIVFRNGSKIVAFEPSDIINSADEYMGSDAALYLENIIQEYKDEIEGLKEYIDILWEREKDNEEYC